MLKSDYVCGLVDGEGCFYILNSKRIACEFQVSQKSVTILKLLMEFFGCGYIKPKYDNARTSVFVVKSIRDLSKRIIPFFKEHSLIIKKEQFEKFAQVVDILQKRQHRTKAGRIKITELKSGTSETIRQASAIDSMAR